MPVQKGYRQTPEHRAAISTALIGRRLRTKHRAAISAARTGMKFSAKHRAALSTTMKEKSVGNQNALGYWHTDETRTKIKSALIGHRHTEVAKRKMSTAQAKHLEQCGFHWPPTSLEYALQLLLESAGLEYEAQKKISHRVVDFWVSSHKLAFEADGSYWHQDTEREVLRDMELVKAGVLAVIHLSEKDLSSWQISSKKLHNRIHPGV